MEEGYLETELRLRVKLTTQDNNIQYIWKSNDKIDDVKLYPIIIELFKTENTQKNINASTT